MTSKCVALSLAAIVLSAASATACQAQDDPAWSLDGYVGVSTDYRDRGISLSGRDPSVSASLGLFHKSGLYGGVDAALIGADFGSNQKTEFYIGYAIDKGDYIYDFSVELEGFHTNESNYYSEFKASVSRDFGLAFIRGGLAYAPEGRWNLPGVDSVYGYADLEVPVPSMPDLTLVTHVGYDVRDGRSNLWNWSVGVSAFINNFEVTLGYEDSSLDNQLAKGQLVLGAKFYF